MDSCYDCGGPADTRDGFFCRECLLTRIEFENYKTRRALEARRLEVSDG